jgi:hypothetical protein
MKEKRHQHVDIYTDWGVDDKGRKNASRSDHDKKLAMVLNDGYEAHLDSDLVMGIPTLDLAVSAVCLYYSCVRDVECSAQTARSFPQDLFDYYAESKMEAAKAISTYVELCGS